MPGRSKKFNADKYVNDICFDYLKKMPSCNVKQFDKGTFNLIHKQYLSIANNIWKHYGEIYSQNTIEAILSISFNVFITNITRIIESKKIYLSADECIKNTSVVLYEVISDKLLFDKAFNYNIIEAELQIKINNKLQKEIDSKKLDSLMHFNYTEIVMQESAKYRSLCANIYTTEEKDLICEKIRYFCNTAGKAISSCYYHSMPIYDDMIIQDARFILEKLATYIFKTCVKMFSLEIKDAEILNFVLYKVAAEVWDIIVNNLQIDNDYQIIEQILEKKYEEFLMQCIQLIVEIKPDIIYQLSDTLTSEELANLSINVMPIGEEITINIDHDYRTVKEFINYKLEKVREKFNNDFYNSASDCSKIYIDNIVRYINLICDGITEVMEDGIHTITILNILIDSLYDRVKAYYMLNQDLLFVFYKLKKHKREHVGHILNECMETGLLNIADLVVCMCLIDALYE